MGNKNDVSIKYQFGCIMFINKLKLCSSKNEILKSKKYLRDLSKGNQKKVGIIATLIGNPEVIILDEPFANLDPTTVSRLKKIIKELVASIQ